MKTYYTLHRPERVPVDAFFLWYVLKDSFYPTHDAVCLVKLVNKEEKQPLYADRKARGYISIEPTAPPPPSNGQEESEEESDGEEGNKPLPPDYQTALEDEAARYHNDDFDLYMLVAWPPKVKIKEL